MQSLFSATKTNAENHQAASRFRVTFQSFIPAWKDCIRELYLTKQGFEINKHSVLLQQSVILY